MIKEPRTRLRSEPSTGMGIFEATGPARGYSKRAERDDADCCYHYRGNLFIFVPNIPNIEPIWNKSVPIQLAQCWFPGLAISNAKIANIFFK